MLNQIKWRGCLLPDEVGKMTAKADKNGLKCGLNQWVMAKCMKLKKILCLIKNKCQKIKKTLERI